MKTRLLTLALAVSLCCTIQVHAQNFWKKLSDGAKGVQDAAKQITSTSSELKNTVTTVKKSWKKDTAANVKYEQVPDYRAKEDVNISKKQKLKIENGQFVNIHWEPVTKFDSQLFPSFIIGWANYQGLKYEDMGSSLGFAINANTTGIVLKWEIECADKNYFSIDSGYVNCDEVNNRLFLPKIAWNYRALTQHNMNAPVNVYFRLVDPNTGSKVEQLRTITLRSINDCLLCYGGKSYNFLFASYVNEDHPAIDPILKQMLNTKMIDQVVGYQFGESYVDLQVAALWRVLHEKGFQYSSITNNSGVNDGRCKGVYAQTVRTFDNALQTSQANCVDGTAFMASILKRMGVRPILVTVPGHCFLGYYTSAGKDAKVHYLETTMLSETEYLRKDSVARNTKLIAGQLPKGVVLSDVNKQYFLQFLMARIEGEVKNKVNWDKYGSSEVEYIDVGEQRTLMLKPIPVYQ